MNWVGRFKATSSPYIDLFFLFKPVKVVNKNSTLYKPKMFVGGMQELDHENYTHMYDTDVRKGFVVVFRTLGFFRLFKVKASEFANYLVNADDFLKNELDDLWGELNELDDPEEMKNVTDRVFERILSNAFPAYNMVDRIFDIIEKSNGILRSDQLAKYLNISQRKLQRLMKNEIGISAKELMQIFRFNFVLNNIHSLEYRKLTEITYLAGYYDQAHFIRDFKRVTGKTPRILLPGNGNGSIVKVDTRSFISQT